MFVRIEIYLLGLEMRDDSFCVFIFYESSKVSGLEERAELVASQLTQKLLPKLICERRKLGFYRGSEACLPMMYYSLLAIQFYLLNVNLVLIDGCIPKRS